jgi:hypothetical protein
MFVEADEHLPVGSPLMCNVPFGRDEQAMQLRGRVAWLRSPGKSDTDRPGGVGIEFVDLSDAESDQLSDIVGGNHERSHQLSLHLEGMESPVRGEAHLTDKGLFFRSPLPFLALESEVGITFPEEESDEDYEGTIVGVDVFNDPGSPIPRLQVEVAVRAEELPDLTDIPAGDEDSDDLEYEMLQIDAADTEKTEGDPEMTALPQEIPIVVVPEEAPSESPPEEAVVQLIQHEETERILKMPLGQVWPAAAVLVGCILGILAFAFSGEEKPPPVAPVNSEASESEQVRALIEAPAQERARVAEEELALARIRAAAMDQSEQELEIEFGDVDVTTEPSTPTAPPSAVSEVESIAGARISSDGEGLVIRLPIEGSLERADDYRLADPPGIAVNLPYAKPRAGFHKSVEPEHEELRALWVRERLGGLLERARAVRGRREPWLRRWTAPDGARPWD